MLPRFNVWISLPTTFFAATVVMMLSSGHSLSAQELNASDGAEGDFFGGFGGSGLSGNTALIGAMSDNDNGSASGSAYLFRNLDTATGTINESVKLLSSDGAEDDLFGRVSLSGNTALIGASRDDDNGSRSGSAYIFRNLDTATGTVNESVKLLPSDGAEDDGFGQGSLSGNTALIGAGGDDDNGSSSGSAYLFRNLDTATGTVNESAKLLPSDGAGGDEFGGSVSLSGNTGLIGASRGDNGLTDFYPLFYCFCGSAYLFRNLDTATGTVNESVQLLASDGAVGDEFGSSVNLDGDRFIVGAIRGDGISADSGIAYTGTVSSVTTLDFGNTSAIIDSISFRSRTDWIIGETTSNNRVELTQGDFAEILELDTGIFVGGNADSNDNRLTISGSVMATTAEIGAAGNVGNQLILNSTATNAIEMLSLHENNSLLIEGEFNTFDLLDTELGSTELFAVLDGNSQLITDLNFDTLLRTSFDDTTGFTTFTVTGPQITHGDVNLDGVVNFLDISPFIMALTMGEMGEFQAQADCNGDGEVNFLDIAPFIQILAG